MVLQSIDNYQLHNYGVLNVLISIRKFNRLTQLLALLGINIFYNLHLVNKGMFKKCELLAKQIMRRRQLKLF